MQTTTEPSYAVLDIGGTSMKAATVGQSGRILVRSKKKTRAGINPSAMLDQMAQLVSNVSVDQHPQALGIGFCGFVDANTGQVLRTTQTLPGWNGIWLCDEMQQRTALPCFCDNDANLAAFAEATVGAGKGQHIVAALTLGTGVGGGVVIAGKLIRGSAFMAGHLGHIKVSASGELCPCGDRGCLEAYLSAFALRRASGRDAKALFADAKKGEKKASKLLAQASRALGTALATINHTINPNIIVLGGGISKGWPQLRQETMKQFVRRSLPDATCITRVVTSTLSDQAGLVGAMLLARAKGQI